MLKVRVAFLIISICVAMWVSVSVYEAFRTAPDQIKLVPYDEYVAKMLDLMSSDVDRFFQMAVLILAGLWAVAIIDKDYRLRLHAHDTPELIMLGVAMALLISFFYFDRKYYEVLSQVYWDVGRLPGRRVFPDLLHSPYIDLHRRVLVRCFYSAMIVSTLTTLSLARLRKVQRP